MHKKLLHAHERERESGEREEKIAREGRIADMREIERESVERIGERGNNPLSLMMLL